MSRLNVAQGLISLPERKTPGRKRASSEVHTVGYKRQVPLEVRHSKAEHMPFKSTPRRCALCSTAKEPHRSRWTCDTCHVALCMDNKKTCFQDFHDNK